MKTISILIATVALLVCFVFILFNLKNNNVKTVSDFDVKFPFRTIYSLENSQLLIPYEIHKKETNKGISEFKVLIKKVHPAKDNYKDYCRSIISDISNGYGTKIIVTIYDDNDAYILNDLQKVLVGQELEFINRHTVATYLGDLWGDEESNYTLWFYKEANNGFYSKEIYRP